MSAGLNPAFEAFLGALPEQKIWAQVLIQRAQEDFELRHIVDREVLAGELKKIASAELRTLASFTESKEFRPLKSAPNLPRGWIAICHGPIELSQALQGLYPGSVADWFAAQSVRPPVTNYREYTNRQSGMYRITQMLSDEQVPEVIRSTCAPASCLKRRLWSVQSLPADAPESKSLIPCLEPCAVLLENARKAMRNIQERVRTSATEPA
jgi:hypothetical protein